LSHLWVGPAGVLRRLSGNKYRVAGPFGEQEPESLRLRPYLPPFTQTKCLAQHCTTLPSERSNWTYEPTGNVSLSSTFMANIGGGKQVSCTTHGTMDYLTDRQAICSADHKQHPHKRKTAFLFPLQKRNQVTETVPSPCEGYARVTTVHGHPLTSSASRSRC
jgi:hypothetical protein